MSVRHPVLLFTILGVSLAHAQSPAPDSAQPAPAVQDKRAYGVLPNNRSAEASDPFHALTARQKLTIAAKDSFDGAVYPTAAIFSVVDEAEDLNQSFGGGVNALYRSGGPRSMELALRLQF